MKKLTLLIVLALSIQISVFSQSCLPDGIEFTTQAEIDNFQTNHPGCTEIEGDVIIHGYDITNFNGLNVLTSFWGSLTIYGTANITNLTGLENVTSIAGLFIWTSDGLNSLTGLENVTSIAGDIEIISNNSLTDLTGMDNLTSLGGSLEIHHNDSITNLSGLNNVDFIEGELVIWDNPSLISLTELNNLDSIGGNLAIVDNDTLASLAGLDNVTSIGGQLQIMQNYALTNLAGLDNINAASINYLVITQNNLLSSCEVKSVCDYLSNPSGNISIFDNAPGCSSQAEVEEVCGIGIPDITFNSEFSVYPNPTEKEIYISGKNKEIIKEVNIYTQIGQKVLHETGITNTIDVSMLKQGIYVIEMVSNERKIREKLIIKK